jgi:predicted MFS family arabinose efflux permease
MKSAKGSDWSSAVPQNKRSSLTAPLRVTLFITGTLLFALVLNVTLSILSLEKIYTDSLISEYTVIGRYYSRKIERSLSFGKLLSKFFGMPELLNEIKEENQKIYQIFIFSAEREPLVSLNQNLPSSSSAVAEQEVMRRRQNKFDDFWLYRKGNYHLIFPLSGGRSLPRTVQGYMEIVLPELITKNKTEELVIDMARLLALFSFSSAIVFLALALLIFSTRTSKYGFSLKTRALLATSIVLIISQIGFSYFSVSDFRDRYFQNIREKCQAMGRLLKKDINYLLGMGIPLNRLVGIDDLLKDILVFTPDLADITIVDKVGESLYRVEAENSEKISTSSLQGVVDVAPQIESGKPVSRSDRKTEYRIVLPVAKDGQPTGFVHLNISRSFVMAKIRDMVFDSATVVVVSLLIGFEFVFFLLARLLSGADRWAAIPRQSEDTSKLQVDVAIPDEKHIYVRTAAFLYAFSMALSMSFLPIYAEDLYTPTLGLGKELVIGLPISVEMLFVAISLTLGGVWLDRRGWFWPFLTGAIITGTGVCFCGVARDIIELMIYRGAVGFGYGLVVMATQSLVIQVSAQERRSSAIAGLEAGFFSGFISSTAVGGMLADRIGFSYVFFLGSVLTMVTILFVLVFLKELRNIGPGVTDQAAAPIRTDRRSGFLSVFKDREFVGILFLSAIPSALCLVGFLYFASPLFLTRAGVGQSDIARLMMIYGMCMVYVAPSINRWVDSLENKKIPIIAGGILGGLALLSFNYLNSVLMFVLILLLFSISGGMSYGARLSLVTDAESSKSTGVGKALGIFNSMERLGNIFGPILVGSMITAVGITQAVSNVGLIYLMGAILLAVLTRKSSRPAVVKRKPH